MSLEEAFSILFKGQANVAKTAAAVGIPTEELKARFREHACRIPIDEDVWQGDVTVAWPWA